MTDGEVLELCRIARWYAFQESPSREVRLYLQAALCSGGSSRDLIQEFVVQILRNPRKENHKHAKTTHAVNGLRWMRYRILSREWASVNLLVQAETLTDKSLFYDEDFEAFDDQIDAREKIKQALRYLTYREREIVKLRYGLSDGIGRTLGEVSRIFKMSRERVRQLERKGLNKMESFFKRIDSELWLLHGSHD